MGGRREGGKEGKGEGEMKGGMEGERGSVGERKGGRDR